MDIKTNPYLFILSLSILSFIAKGIMYMTIGSYVPIFLSVLVLGVFIITRKRPKLLILSIKFWAISLIIWAVLRIVIGIIDFFVKPLTENHLHQQLGIAGMIISLIFLGVGFYLLKGKNRINWLLQ